MKFKAFSIIELMVSILISGVVISTAFSVYVFMHKSLAKYSTSKTAIKNYFELSAILNKDVEGAKQIIKVNDFEISLNLLDKTVNYEFKNDYILRVNQLQTDTFFFKVDNVLISTINEKYLVNYLHLKLDNGLKSLTISKDYGAIIYIED